MDDVFTDVYEYKKEWMDDVLTDVYDILFIFLLIKDIFITVSFVY